MTDLDRWHEFETKNPDTFSGMYQFWVQKHLTAGHSFTANTGKR